MCIVCQSKKHPGLLEAAGDDIDLYRCVWLKSLSGCKEARRLRVWYCSLETVGTMVNMTSLECCYCNNLKYIHPVQPKLVNLEVHGSDHLREVSMFPLLSKLSVSMSVVCFIHHLPRLETLVCDNLMYLMSISDMPRLNELRVTKCPLVYISRSLDHLCPGANRYSGSKIRNWAQRAKNQMTRKRKAITDILYEMDPRAFCRDVASLVSIYAT